MRNRANANTSISLRICAPRYVLLVKEVRRTGCHGALNHSTGIRCISRFVFRDECLAKLIECPVFNLGAGLAHQVQIKMQIVQRDQAKPENFLSLNEVANVAARKLPAGRDTRSFLLWAVCPA